VILLDTVGFKGFLEERNLDPKTVKSSLTALRDFEEYLTKNGKEIESATRKDFYSYSADLIKKGKNTVDNFISILRYGYFKKLKEIIIAGLEVLDGSEVIENLSKRLANEFDQALKDYVFNSIEIPPLGISPAEKPAYTKKLIARLEEKLGTEECAKFLNRGLRDSYEESRKPDRQKFLRSNGLNDFLKQKHRDFVAELEKHYSNGTLLFTQEITKEVLEYVRGDPYFESGVREDDRIIIKKIPHMAREYLAEKDEQKKRYYYCHCPWVKEAFKGSSKPLSPVFCNCSAGFYRAYWEIVFDQPVRVDVVASLLNGDPICKFAVHIPSNIL
jgi:hypothetical protein